MTTKRPPLSACLAGSAAVLGIGVLPALAPIGAAASQPDATTVFSTRTVFHGLVDAHGDAYDGTAKSVRIPSMAVTDDGTVIVAADARVDSSRDLPNNIQIALRRSTDNGATWSPARIVAHGPTSASGTGDSSLLVDRRRNRVYLFFNYGPPGIGYKAPRYGSGSTSTDDPDSLHIRYRTSDDDGATWSAPRDLNPAVKNPAWDGFFTSSGHGIQTSGGRLLQPIVHRDATGTHASNIYSDDHGATWHTGAPAATGVNESKAIERGDGTVAQNMRSDTLHRRVYATSPDGVRPYGPAAPSATLIDPRANADEISYLAPGRDGLDPRTCLPRRTRTALFSNPASRTSARENLTVRLSTDDGATWPYAAVVRPGPAGYSSAAVLGDGSVADLYEIDGAGGIVFARFTLDWIKDFQGP